MTAGIESDSKKFRRISDKS